MSHDMKRGSAEPALESRLAGVVRIEIILAAAAMALGLIVALVRGTQVEEAAAPGILARLIAGDGAAVASLGIFLLLAIPVTFVVFAIGHFTSRREYPFALASALVLLLLVAGALSGLT